MEVKPNILGHKKINISATPSVTPIAKGRVNSGTENGAGSIAKQIGTGDNAKDSFVWMTLRACFWIAGLMSVGFFIISFISFFVKDDFAQEELNNSLRASWSIFSPIITLALGYAFGKRENK